MNVLIAILRVVGVFAALVAGTLVGGMLVTLPAPTDPAIAVGQQQIGLVVLLVYALVLSVLAAVSTRGPLTTAFLLFTVAFFLHTGLNLAELYIFADALGMQTDNLGGMAILGTITMAAGSLAAAFLWTRKQLVPGFRERPAGSWLIRFLLAVAIYPAIYWLAGYFIAYSTEAVRAAYDIEAVPGVVGLVSAQLARGVVWALLALIIVTMSMGTRGQRALLTGFVFALLMAVLLLVPNEVMSAEVRYIHLVELLVSNFAYGLIAGWILAPGRDRLHY